MRTVVAVLVLLLVVGEALGLTGQEVLEKVDQVMNAPRDRVASVRMVLVEKGGATKERRVKMYQKGEQKRLVKFLSPAEVKGVGFLVLSDEEMYLWMPAFGKIRRIASHVKNRSFMGTDFSYDDIGSSTYSDDYYATVKEEDQKGYVLELSPRPGSDVDYSRLVVWVPKDSFVPSRVEFYKKGRLMKVMTNERVERVDGFWVPRKVVMENVRTGHKTLMEMVEVRHNIGLGDKIFTKRYLKKRLSR